MLIFWFRETACSRLTNGRLSDKYFGLSSTGSTPSHFMRFLTPQFDA